MAETDYYPSYYAVSAIHRSIIMYDHLSEKFYSYSYISSNNAYVQPRTKMADIYPSALAEIGSVYCKIFNLPYTQYIIAINCSNYTFDLDRTGRHIRITGAKLSIDRHASARAGAFRRVRKRPRSEYECEAKRCSMEAEMNFADATRRTAKKMQRRCCAVHRARSRS